MLLGRTEDEGTDKLSNLSLVLEAIASTADSRDINPTQQ
jgi:hypothetical protein